MTSEQVNIETVSMTERCDRLLIEAGLQCLWRPRQVSRTLAELAKPVLDLAQEQATPDTDLAKVVCRLGSKVVEIAASNYLPTPRIRRSMSFRAHTATSRGKGNCISMHEVVNGIYTKLGLGDHVVGSWNGVHAASGLVVGGSTFMTDGCSPHRSTDAITNSLSSREREAWQSAVHDGLAVRLAPLRQLHETIETKPIDHLHKFRVLPGRDQQVILPGAAAVVMFSAMAAQGGGHKYEHAKEVLKPFALAA